MVLVVIMVMVVLMIIIMVVIVMVIMVMMTVVILGTMIVVLASVGMPVAPAGGVIAVIVAVTLVITVICRGRSRREGQSAQSNNHSGGARDDCLADGEGACFFSHYDILL